MKTSKNNLKSLNLLESKYQLIYHKLEKIINQDRLIIDPLKRFAYGTDASFYRLTPQIVVIAESEQEIIKLLKISHEFNVSVTFRAGGTSLSGQAVTDSILVCLNNDAWKKYEILENASKIRVQVGLIGSQVNQYLMPFNKKIGPDPASINSAMIGGILANNSSGMCCGTAKNSYNTLDSIRVILADGTLLDTSSSLSIESFQNTHAHFLKQIQQFSDEVKQNHELFHRIQHKFKMKNTTGYSLNALIDFTDPIDILSHLLIGSEGTLGCITEVVYRTVDDFPHKASGLILFNDIKIACEAVAKLKNSNAPVDAVELMDFASLRSVENKLSCNINHLGENGSALLIDIRGDCDHHLEEHINIIKNILKDFNIFGDVFFTSDSKEIKKLWDIRKGMFPSVGAIRQSGTTVIIEDIAVQVNDLASATIDLQNLMKKYAYHNSIIFGHALEGNLHFVFTQDFSTTAEVQRYSDFMDDVCKLIVEKYNGALKAEHGTGRNMAPFVELEWGSQAYQLMRKIKDLFDPKTILNAGVILNNDPSIHLQNLKEMFVTNEWVDKCIECGFCEVKCPSHQLTLSPRQRIASQREISRLRHKGDFESQKEAKTLEMSYNYNGIDTCATCNLCATVCPVEIETGNLIKVLRTKQIQNSPTKQKIGQWISDHFDTTTNLIQTGLKVGHAVGNFINHNNLHKITDKLNQCTNHKIDVWSTTMPIASDFKISQLKQQDSNQPTVIYFPSCSSRTMGTENLEALPTVAERLFKRGGFNVVYPQNTEKLCCGMPFESKGLTDIADQKRLELMQQLNQLISMHSSDHEVYVVFDTSPCAFRSQLISEEFPQFKIFDITEFLSTVLIQKLQITKKNQPIMIHPTCSTQKLGLSQSLIDLAKACCDQVIVPEQISCCGFAGDKGFSHPELNQHALRHLKKQVLSECTSGYSTSRTCEIGLSSNSGINYQSIVYLIDECSK